MQFSSLLSIAGAFTVALMSLTAQAAPTNAATKVSASCLGFRITSPTSSGLGWTYGQCYSVDWDLGASKVTSIASVKLVNAATGVAVATEVQNIPASQGTTGNFPLILGDDLQEGLYYFSVVGAANGASCQLNSVPFRVSVNPNSPPNTSC
ncbi:hypothetical protein BDF14DRAFT_1824033 [Spinellus fusiger]|nr:hypothetical protein BDF14DRAFT_1824033 [Spinellus fusiger]